MALPPPNQMPDPNRIQGVIPNPCTVDAENRNWDAVINLRQITINIFNKLLNALNLGPGLIAVDGDGVPSLPMQAKWAVSMGDEPGETFIAPAAGNNWRGQIKAFPCDDSQGNNRRVVPIWIVLPERTDTSVHLPKGSVFAYEETDNGERVAVSDYSGEHRIRWGIAQTDSTTHVDVDRVVVRECDDALGANPVAPDLTILLPERVGYTHDVAADDVIAFVTASDGSLVCVSDYSLIERIIRFELTGALVPAGNASVEILSWDGAAVSGTGAFTTVHDYDTPGRWRGEIGYRGIAIRKKDASRFEVIYLESIAQFAAVELVENMDATAVGESRGAMVLSSWNGNPAPTTITVWDKHTIFAGLQAGDRLIVAYDWTNAKYFPFDNKGYRDYIYEYVLLYGGSFIEFITTNDMAGLSCQGNVTARWGSVDPGADPVTLTDAADLFTGARTGATGYAVWDSTRLAWIILECQSLAGWGWGTLLANMSGTPKKASCQVDGAKGTQQDVQSPGTTIDVYGITGISDTLETDARVQFLYSSVDNRYYAFPIKIEEQAEYIEFETTEAYASGGWSADVISYWKGSNPGASVTLVDPAVMWPHALGPAATFDGTGASGYAVKQTDGTYVPLACEQEALSYIGPLTTSLTGSTGDIGTMTPNQAIGRQGFTQRTGEEEVEFGNPHAFVADSGATVEIIWDYTSGGWIAHQVDCPAEA